MVVVLLATSITLVSSWMTLNPRLSTPDAKHQALRVLGPAAEGVALTIIPKPYHTLKYRATVSIPQSVTGRSYQPTQPD